MSMISTVNLPVVQATDTIRTAIDRLKAEGKSGVVALNDGGPVVMSDRFLENSLTAYGGDMAEMSQVAKSAYPLPEPESLFSKWSGKLGKRSKPAAEPRQRDYVVLKWDDKDAVVTTDPRRAVELSRPTSLFKADT